MASSSPAARVAGIDFRPPRLHPPTLRLFQRLLPGLLRRVCGVVSVDIPAEDTRRLRALAGERLLLAPNHPTNDDPALLFALAQAAGMPFHYLCCREAFDHLYGLWGWLIQRLGAYSVVRGTTDRDSFRTTRALLSAPAGKVVIFPEGEMHSQNDTLLPFHMGVVQLAFWALEDLRKAGDPAASVSLLPVGLRYFFTEDMTAAIDGSLDRLRWALLPHDRKYRLKAYDDQYEFLRDMGIKMLEVLEAEYGLKTKSAGGEADLTPRLHALKSLLLDRAAGLIGVPLPSDATLPERMRLLINAVYAATHDEATPRSPYQARVHRQQAARVAPLLQDLNRVANWIAVQDNYVRARPTPERMADTLRRLEIEAFGKSSLHGPRRALVRVGEPISLAPCYDAYRADKRATVARVTHELEAAVQGLLDTGKDSVAAVSVGDRVE